MSNRLAGSASRLRHQLEIQDLTERSILLAK